MFTVQSRFYTTFKTGDNVAYNTQILRLLYRCQKRVKHENKIYFAKPIIIQIASIAETVMYDFRSRFRHCHKEVRSQFSEDIILRFDKLDEEPKFGQLLAALTQTKLVESKDKFIQKATEMKNLRDRVHIQNTKSKGKRDEQDAFTIEKQREAEQVLERLLKALETNCARDQSMWSVENIKLPWQPHFAKSKLPRRKKQKPLWEDL